MEYISNNKELNKAIIQMYQREIDPYQLADIYLKYKLYSAASTYYVMQLNDLHNCKKEEYQLKSYCFGKLAECYYNQQKDHIFSGWQLSLIYDMCKEAIGYDRNNLVAYLILGKCQILRNNIKDAYFTYNDMILNLPNVIDFDPQYIPLFVNVIIEYFNLCELFYIIKYEHIYRNIINFMLKFPWFTYKDIKKVNERYQNHLDKITEYELDIMEGNIQKYYYP